MTVYFVVRAQVSDASLKKDFDRWYQDEHLPDALKAFKAKRAWRGWSQLDGTVHYAYYEFDDAASARAIQNTEAFQSLVAEFDRCWGDKVTRSRDIVEIVHKIGA